MAFVPLFAPAIPQIRRKLEVSTQARGSMGVEWFENIVGQLLAGVDWVLPNAVTLFALAAIVFGFALLGLLRMLRDRTWIAVLPIAGCALAFVHFSLTDNELLKWYVFYALPFLLLLTAVGMEINAKAGWAVLVYLLVASPILYQRVTRPLQQSREASLVVRNADEGKLYMGASDIVSVGLYQVSSSYDPRMRQGRDQRSGEALLAIVEECRTAGKKLRVNATNLGFARLDHPDFFAVLENPAVFRKTGDFPAAEPYLEIETYEMLP